MLFESKTKLSTKAIVSLYALLVFQFIPARAEALDQYGNGDTSGVVALYTFKEGSGNVVYDHISTGGALNLSITGTAGSYSWSPMGLDIESPLQVFVQSSGPATKVINACNASNAMTIEVWVLPQSPNQAFLQNDGPVRIAALTNGVLNNGGIYLGEGYNAGAFFDLGIHTIWQQNNGMYSETGEQFTTNPSDNTIVQSAFAEHIIVTRDSSGNVEMYVSDQSGTPILQIPFGGAQTPMDKNASLGLSANDYLTVGNDIDPGSTAYPTVPIEGAGSQPISNKQFLGELQMVAVYCNSLTQSQVLGALAPTNWLATSNYTVNPNAPITSAQTMASIIYQRIAGVTLPIDHPTILQMANILAANPNDPNTRMQAAAIAASAPSFYNITVRDFAKRMSNISGLTQIPLNDFSANIIGATRDGMDARQILTGDYYYIGDPTKTAVPNDSIASFALSNDHYAALDAEGYDLSSVLIKKTGQLLYNGAGTLVPAAQVGDAGGLLTTRQFAAQAFSAGTNRRAIRFAFNAFLCEDITVWADATAPDAYVGRDVDRFPTGDHNVYLTTCKACHAQMDAMRPAFAHFTYDPDKTDAGYLKDALIVGQETAFSSADGFTNPPPAGTALVDQADDETNPAFMVQSPMGVAGKYNKNVTVFPAGYAVSNDSWVNYTNRPGTADRAYFGWSQTNVQSDSSIAGQGVGAFASMLANAQAYPGCLAQRVFQSVCQRAPNPNSPADQELLTQVVQAFTTTDKYNLQTLFERIAVQPDCLGE